MAPQPRLTIAESNKIKMKVYAYRRPETKRHLCKHRHTSEHVCGTHTLTKKSIQREPETKADRHTKLSC